MSGRTAGALVMCGAAVGCGVQQRPPPAADATAEVRTALALAVGLLEAKDHAGFVARFLPPADLDCAVAAGGTPESVAATRLADPAPLLARLRQARRAEPTFADRGATAVFAAGAARVVFRRVGGKWYFDWT